MKASIPINESARLEALKRYQLLDTEPQQTFNDLPLLASQICSTPVSLITLIDEHRQWFKSRIGFPLAETSRDISFCAHAILQNDIFTVPDTLKDDRFSTNPLVTADPKIRFYAGAPLLTSDGCALGTLCVIDQVPRSLDKNQKEALWALARQVMVQIELRIAVLELSKTLDPIRLVYGSENPVVHLRGLAADLLAVNRNLRSEVDIKTKVQEALRESEEQLRIIVESATDTIITINQSSIILFANHAAEKTFGYATSELIGQELTMLMPDYLRLAHRSGIKRYTETGKRHLAWDAIQLPGLHKNGNEISMEISFGEFVRNDNRYFSGIIRDVTQRKKAESMAHLTSERLSLALDASNVSLWDCDLATGKVYLSDGWSVMMGDAPKETYTTVQELTEITHPDDRQKAWAVIRDTLKGIVPNYREVHRVRKLDGEWIWVESTGKVVERGSDGRARRMIGTNVNVTERKRTLDELRKYQQEQKVIFDSVPAMIWFKNTDNRILRLNKMAAEVLAISATEVEGKSTYDHYPAESAKYHADDLEVIRSGNPKFGIEEILHLENGEHRWVKTDKIPYRDADGNITGVIVFAVDITERKRFEESLRRSEAEYRSLVQGATFGIYRSNAAGKFIAVNEALVKMLGYDSAAELLAVDIARDIYVDPNVRGRLIAENRNAEQANNIEVEWKRKDGTKIIVRLNWRILRDEQGQPQYFEGIAENVTERRLLEDQLRQSQKMEAVGQLAGGIAHDFNNLLTVIRGYTELSADRLQENDPERENVQKVLQAADRASLLTQQLLAFSRKQVLSPKVLDLNHFVAETCKLLPRLLRENIEMTLITTGRSERVNVDPGQLSQVIINLAINARDAMPQGGKLHIETAKFEVDEHHQGVVPRGHYAVITVRDTGSGMDTETQSHIFEPFFTTKDLGKGTGLGLSTVYGIVKQSHGFIFVESKMGEGTAFTIYLPAVRGDVQRLEQDNAGSEYLARGSETILLVEDEKNVREIARKFLEMQGYSVLEAEDTVSAIQIAKEHGRSIHLVLSDVIMPTMSGPELTQRLAVFHPRMKVVFISGYTDDAIAHHGVLQPGISLLQKPFTREALSKIVRKVLDGNPRM